MENLKLTIPSQQEGQHILVETDQGKLAEWLGSLPLGDMSRALPEITRAISSLNRTELPYKKRAALVQLFDTTYRLVHDYYRPKLSIKGQNLQLEQENLQRFANLTREMAFAHKIIVNDCQKKHQLWGKNKTKVKAISYAIFYLGLMLIEQYEKYAPIPIYIWREINSLFAHAGKEQIERVKISTDNSYCLSNIEQNYIRNCLIALAAPYRLAAGQHWQVFQYLNNWSHLVCISEDPDDFRKDACFIIDVTSENKPSFVTQELNDPEDPKIRLLITFDIIRQIEFDLSSFQEKRQLPNKGFHPSITAESAIELWTHLSKHWKKQVERSYRRYPIVTKVDVVWGIQAVCKVLEETHKDNREPITLEAIKELLHLDPSDTLTWDVNNVSTEGIGLSSNQFMILNIRLGDVVLVREYMDNKPASLWRLAICRWHTGDKNNGTILGLNYVDGKCSPARLILHQGKNDKGGQSAIIVSDTENDSNKASTIIAAKGSSQSNRVYAMLGLDQAVEIRPRNQVEQTACIDRFFYQTYELREELAKEINDDITDVIPWTTVPHEKGNIDDTFEIDEDSVNPKSLDDLILPDD